MKKAIVNINIEIPCPNAKTDEEATIIAENYELPKEYVEDSFELVKIIDDNEENQCDHEWSWNYDCFEDARILEADTLGIPVKCDKCGLEAIEWWGYSCVKDNNGNTID